MARDEIRFSIPAGPDQKAKALAIMAELSRRIVEEEEAREREATLPASEAVIIEHEPDDG